MGLTVGSSFVQLPSPKGCVIDLQGLCQRLPTQTMAAAVREQFLAQRPRLRRWVISKKSNDLWPVVHGRVAAVFFPIGVGFFFKFEAFAKIALEKTQFRSPLF